jgi:imidazole glycerol-phosphate synthase subunit HisH
MITIIDYGIGNVASVKNMLKACGTDCSVSHEPETILQSEKIILPGVGAFDEAMIQLNRLNLSAVIQEFALSDKPLLGICLGAQLLLDKSEEGEQEGLKLIPGYCKKFQSSKQLRVPHMGWSEVKFLKQHLLVEQPTTPRFYFVHSYYMVCSDVNDVLGVSEYGKEFVSVVNRKNIFGVQFHPEKSHRFGMQLLKNFVSL